ncbi:MAG TPA: SDR family oxidoreductase [Gammaproteobacteria bacterium]
MKRALVTGGSGDIGSAICRRLARDGMHVLVHANSRPERAEAVVASICESGGSAEAVVFDVTDGVQCREVLGALAGEAPIQVLVNNAGLAVAKPAQDFSDDDYDLIMDTNLKGAWLCAQAVGRRMIRHGHGGKIVNVASLVALKPIGQLSLYGISKAAVAEMSRCLALEWQRYDIQVNAICPGYVETEMNAAHWRSEAGKALIRRFPAKRLMPVEALDALLLLLASSGSDHMTGAVIPIDEAQSLM